MSDYTLPLTLNGEIIGKAKLLGGGDVEAVINPEHQHLFASPVDNLSIYTVPKKIPYRVLVTGSRSWTDEGLIREMFKIINGTEYGHREITLIHGTAAGADTMAERAAQDLGWKIERHPANWDLYGKRAGYIRNAEMVKASPDICLAFIHNHSKGATMCADLAVKAGIPTKKFEKD